jgi:Uma2 family endonuclease
MLPPEFILELLSPEYAARKAKRKKIRAILEASAKRKQAKESK